MNRRDLIRFRAKWAEHVLSVMPNWKTPIYLDEEEQKMTKQCPQCKGERGFERGMWVACSMCQGSGSVVDVSTSGRAVIVLEVQKGLMGSAFSVVGAIPPSTEEQRSCDGCGGRAAPWQGWQRPDAGQCWWTWDCFDQSWVFTCKLGREDVAEPAPTCNRLLLHPTVDCEREKGHDGPCGFAATPATPVEPRGPRAPQAGDVWSDTDHGRGWTLICEEYGRWRAMNSGGAAWWKPEHFTDGSLVFVRAATPPAPVTGPHTPFPDGGCLHRAGSHCDLCRTVAGAAPVAEKPTPENCPGCAKVSRHPGEGYGCAWHPAPAVPQSETGTRQEARKDCPNWCPFNAEIRPNHHNDCPNAVGPSSRLHSAITRRHQ